MNEVGIGSRFEYVGFWRRVGVMYLDALIVLPILPVTFWADQWSFRLRSPWPSVIPAVLPCLVMLYFVVRFGGTPGKLILGMRIVDRHGVYLHVGRAFVRDLFSWLDVVIVLLSILRVISGLPTGEVPSNMKQIADAYSTFGGPWSSMHAYWFCIWTVDVLVVCTNRRKRAAHDFLAGSFVITRRSYDAANCRTV